MSLEIIGKVRSIGQTVEIGAKGFKKRDIIITTDEKYPQDILIQFVQDKVELLNNFKIGQEVKILINIRGREWKNLQGEIKFFNTIQGWKIEPIQSTGLEEELEEKNDDLPFSL